MVSVRTVVMVALALCATGCGVAQRATDSVSVGGVAMVPESSPKYVRVAGVVYNGSGEALDVRVQCRVFDASGRIAGSHRAFVGAVPAGGGRPFASPVFVGNGNKPSVTGVDAEVVGASAAW